MRRRGQRWLARNRGGGEKIKYVGSMAVQVGVRFVGDCVISSHGTPTEINISGIDSAVKCGEKCIEKRIEEKGTVHTCQGCRQ